MHTYVYMFPNGIAKSDRLIINLINQAKALPSPAHMSQSGSSRNSQHRTSSS